MNTEFYANAVQIANNPEDPKSKLAQDYIQAVWDLEEACRIKSAYESRKRKYGRLPSYLVQVVDEYRDEAARKLWALRFA